MPVLFNKKNFDNYYGGKGLRRGVVKEVKVVDKLNTLVVELVEEKLELPCVHVMSEIAHKKTGKVVIPSVGDEVLVAFVDNDITKPVVIGSVYNAENLPPFTTNKDNMNMCITFPSGKASDGKPGLKIEISCKAKKQKVTITSEKGHKIELDDDKEKTQITSKNGKTSFMIDIKNGKIVLKAEKSVALTAGKNTLSLDSNKGAHVTCKSGDFKTESNNIKQAAKANADISSKAKATFQTNGNVKIGGAMVKVNANGILQLKGSMTKIN